MRFVVTPILGVIAVACIVLGVLNATIWKPDRDITAEASVSGTRYVVTDPGVLGLVDDAVTMTVTGGNADATVCTAIGSMKDVAGWLSGTPYVRVTGLSEWTALSTTDAEAQGESLAGDGDVAFADSDMWTSVACDTGGVTIEATDEDSSRVALVDLGEDEASADIAMQWVRQSLPNYALPFYIGGGVSAVLAVLSATVLAMPWGGRRKRETEPEEQPSDGEPTIVDPAARNLVADQLESSDTAEAAADASEDASGDVSDDASDGGDDADADVSDQTSVISQDELMAYFARFAQEDTKSDAAGTQDADASVSTDAAAESDADAPADETPSPEGLSFSPMPGEPESPAPPAPPVDIPELSFDGLVTMLPQDDEPSAAQSDDVKEGE